MKYIRFGYFSYRNICRTVSKQQFQLKFNKLQSIERDESFREADNYTDHKLCKMFPKTNYISWIHLSFCEYELQYCNYNLPTPQWLKPQAGRKYISRQHQIKNAFSFQQ